MNERLEYVLSHFDVKSKKGKTAQCICPCHNDKQASLSISAGNKKIVLYCHAGCNHTDILNAVGLQGQDLYYENNYEHEKQEWKDWVQEKENAKLEATYDYHCISDGSYSHTKLRFEGKKFIQGVVKDDKFVYGSANANQDTIYGDLEKIKDAVRQGKNIYYVEGEKDVDTMKKYEYDAFTFGSVNARIEGVTSICKDAHVVVLADNDDTGINFSKKICEMILPVAKSCKMIIPTPDKSKGDISDYFEWNFQKNFDELVKKAETVTKTVSACAQTSMWDIPSPKTEEPLDTPSLVVTDKNNIKETKELLEYNISYNADGKPQKGKVKSTINNIHTILKNDTRIAGKIKLNDLSEKADLISPVPWTPNTNRREWVDTDDSYLREILQTDYGISSFSHYRDAFSIYLNDNHYNPILNILDNLPYNGDGFIRKLLPDYLGCEDSDYNYEVMKLFFLAAIHRLKHPGCKFDYVIIFSGAQGIGKSTFVEKLALKREAYYSCSDSLDDDDAIEKLQGAWIVEFPELVAFKRTKGGNDMIKKFTASTTDKYRQKYAVHSRTIKRKFVCIGTVNEDEFLTDETGNRRFLIIECGQSKNIKKNLFSKDSEVMFENAWAEAMHMYKQLDEIKLVLPDAFQSTAKQLQEKHMEDDGKRSLIHQFLETHNEVCTKQIWIECLQKANPMSKKDSQEISNIIMSTGKWKKNSPKDMGEKYRNQRYFSKIQ